MTNGTHHYFSGVSHGQPLIQLIVTKWWFSLSASPSVSAKSPGSPMKGLTQMWGQMLSSLEYGPLESRAPEPSLGSLCPVLLDPHRPPPLSHLSSLQNETDESQIQLAGGDVELPRELAKMIEEDTEEEEDKASVLGQLASLPGLDLSSLKDKAQTTLGDLKQSAEKCHIM